MTKIPKFLIKFSWCKTLIPNNLFNECSSLTQISIPSSKTSIGSFAFSGCSSLKQIIIPTSVSIIGENIFEGCKCLTKILIDPLHTKFDLSSFEDLTFNEIIIESNKNMNIIEESLEKSSIDNMNGTIFDYTNIDEPFFNSQEIDVQIHILNLVKRIKYNKDKGNLENICNIFEFFRQEEYRSKMITTNIIPKIKFVFLDLKNLILGIMNFKMTKN